MKEFPTVHYCTRRITPKWHFWGCLSNFFAKREGTKSHHLQLRLHLFNYLQLLQQTATEGQKCWDTSIKWPLFCRLSKSPYFFPGWLWCDLIHWSSLRSLLRTHKRSSCNKSTFFCMVDKSIASPCIQHWFWRRRGGILDPHVFLLLQTTLIRGCGDLRRLNRIKRKKNGMVDKRARFR